MCALQLLDIRLVTFLVRNLAPFVMLVQVDAVASTVAQRDANAAWDAVAGEFAPVLVQYREMLGGSEDVTLFCAKRVIKRTWEVQYLNKVGAAGAAGKTARPLLKQTFPFSCGLICLCCKHSAPAPVGWAACIFGRASCGYISIFTVQKPAHLHAAVATSGWL